MKEENNGAPNKKWSRIFRKKWFFPAMYLTIAALLLTVVVWYQNLDNQLPDALDQQEMNDNYNPSPYDEDAESVLEQQEVIKMPVTDQDQAEIVTKFYDYNAEQADQESGLVLYNNRYYQSTGIDIAAAEEEPFDVVAALSGTVTEVKEDPLLGNVVILTHENDVMTYYASLGEIDVKTGSKVKQGDILGTAGKNLFGKENGIHVHFELRKDGQEVNPEMFFNQPVSKLDSLDTESVENAEDPESSESDENKPELEQVPELEQEEPEEGSEELDQEEDKETDNDVDIETEDEAAHS